MNIAEAYEQLARENRWDEALPLIEEFVRLNPKSATGWFNLGVCLSELRRSCDAAAAFETAYELDPEHHNAQYRMFRNLYYSGAFDQFLAKLRDECESDRAAIQPFLNDELYGELFNETPFKEFRKELQV
ncbi:MAG: tetratricopeptide repeat protein [bacterium]|nr:tetratricopeptide repeat protein [bacterium]